MPRPNWSPPGTPPDVRLMSKVDKKQTGCWEWTGAKRKKGYGSFQWGGKPWAAHRAAWTMFRGPIPEGLVVCHRCDNPPCINPDHLFIGTARDNVGDAIAKGRRPRMQQVRRAIGENHGRALLTEDDVRFIRSHRALGSRSLAMRFGVARSTVKNVLAGETWRHLEVAA